MADRVTPPTSDDSVERRPAASRTIDSQNDRPQPTRTFSVYGDPSQPARSGSGSGGYTQRPQSARSAENRQRPQPTRSGSSYGERRPAAPRSAGGSGGRPNPPRRVDVIRCENCGEDYNVSYKRCPFCDERPGRGGVTGKRVSNTRGGGYGRPVNPVQIAGLVISLVLIASALFIVVRFVGAPIFGGKNKPSNSGSDVSSSLGSQSNTGTPAGPNATGQPVQSISLNHTDFSLDNAGTYQLAANLLPEGATGDVTWSSSDSTAATVDETGLVTNVNAGSSDIAVTITATCGDITASTTVTCKGKPSGSGTVSNGTRGRVVNAEKGLNIRSGPGKNYDVVASAQNGATLTILGEENGFYKINYSGSKVGYVSKDYISIIG